MIADKATHSLARQPLLPKEGEGGWLARLGYTHIKTSDPYLNTILHVRMRLW